MLPDYARPNAVSTAQYHLPGVRRVCTGARTMHPRTRGCVVRTGVHPEGGAEARKNLRNLMVPEVFLGWQMRDSNPRRRCQLIYSQPPLAARVICRTSKEVPADAVSGRVRFRSVPLQ